MTVIHAPTENSPFLVVSKKAGLPSAPLFEGDESVLTEAVRLFPEIALVHGKKEAEHGLVHRIDTETSGLVLIAATQNSYDSLIQSQKNGEFEKWYRAEIDFVPDCPGVLGGFPPVPKTYPNPDDDGDFSLSRNGKFTIESAFRAFGKGGREVRPVTTEAGRAALKKGGKVLYKTDVSFEGGNTALCHITAGFRHQVRCHLAWCGFPVKGDKIYNPSAKSLPEEDHGMRFTACKISFPHPLTGLPQVFET